MRKVFKIENIDCPNCARKMEIAANKVDGVNKVTVNYMAGKLIVDAKDDGFTDIVNNIAKAIKNIDYECEVIR